MSNLEQNRIDTGPAVDIDTLMARICRAAAQRLPEMSLPSATPATNGAHGAMQALADFNVALVESLGSLAGYLQDERLCLATIQRLEGEVERNTHSVQEAVSQFNDLRAALDQEALLKQVSR